MKIEKSIIDNINASIDTFKTRIAEGEEKLKNIEEEYKKLMKKAKADTEADLKECRTELAFWESVASRYSDTLPEDEKVVDTTAEETVPETVEEPEGETAEAPEDIFNAEDAGTEDAGESFPDDFPGDDKEEPEAVEEESSQDETEIEDLRWPTQDEWEKEPQEWK